VAAAVVLESVGVGVEVEAGDAVALVGVLGDADRSVAQEGVLEPLEAGVFLTDVAP